jgi:hypothetical protein
MQVQNYSDVLRHHNSSGDRIRTCDLWVMSQPVAVSSSHPASQTRRSQSIARPSHHTVSHTIAAGCVAFRSQIRSRARTTTAPVFNRAHSELRRPLGSQSSACRRGWTWKRRGPARDLDAENAKNPRGRRLLTKTKHTTENDEAHDVLAGALGATPADDSAPLGALKLITREGLVHRPIVRHPRTLISSTPSLSPVRTHLARIPQASTPLNTSN